MKLVGTASGSVVVPLSPADAFLYLHDPGRLLRAVPQCVMTAQLHPTGIYQWSFDMEDPFGNIFRVHSVIRQRFIGHERVVWQPFELDWSRVRFDGLSFLGRATGDIRVTRLAANRSRLEAGLEFAIDFALPGAMRKLPLGWVERTSAKLMDRKMGQFVGQILRSLETSLGASLESEIHSSGQFA
jgi:hypothetical protein